MMPVAQQIYRRQKIREERKAPRGLDAFSFAWAGRWRRWRNPYASLRQRALLIEEEIKRLSSQTDAEIVEQTGQAAARLFSSKPSDEALALGLAGSALAAQRTMGLSPYPEQLQAALALFDGYLAEMATGEGKTLAIALAAGLMGMTRLPCHVVTANDYLAERDATEYSPFYRFFGLRTDCVVGAKETDDRAIGYAASVTYTTPKEVLADFLRDQLKIGRVQDPTRQLIRQLGGMSRPQQNLVLRGLHFGIIDEADSVLIDEAVTPLIISRPVKDQQLEEALKTALQICRHLESGIHYEVNYRFRDIYLSENQWEQLMPAISHFPPWWRSPERFREAIRLTLLAREFYHKDIQYVIQDEKLELIDESTGRIMLHRTWQHGVHQAVEAKEHIPLTANAEAVASLSFQRFFCCYPRLSGLSGTVHEAAAEAWQSYHLPFVKIPTHRPLRRIRQPTRIFQTRAEACALVASRVQDLRVEGRPLLIGTRTLRASEELAHIFQEAGIPFQLLNASRNAEEAHIISQAGQPARVTIATNMAGRGTDIKLGDKVADGGGLHVIATECNPSGRIDRQLLGRAGRQGDPGSGEFILSLEDDLLVKYVPAPFRKLLNQYFKVPFVEQMLTGWAFAFAQHLAEWENRDQRRKTLRGDTWLDEHLTFAGRSTALR